MFKKIFYLLFLLNFLFLSCSNNDDKLKIYSVIHDEETQTLTELFTKKTGIQTIYIKASTGELVNRVIAEKDNPLADILLGGASSYHIQANEQGALESYNSPNAQNIPEYAKSADNTWTGFCLLTLGIGINQEQFNKKFPNEKIPQSWDDLLNPVFKNEIVMTNPLSSSTAYLFVQNQLQRLGKQQGWKYLLTLASLVGQFPDSGSAPSKFVGTGEYAIGISYLHALMKYKSQGFNITLVSPPKSCGDVDCISIIKNTKNLNAAKKFVDFILSKEAQELMSSLDYTIPVCPEATPADGAIPISQIDLIDYDSKKAANEKDEVLDFWSKNVK